MIRGVGGAHQAAGCEGLGGQHEQPGPGREDHGLRSVNERQ